MRRGVLFSVVVLLILQFVLFGNSQSQTNDNKTFDGYTLFQSLFGTTTYLINMDGEVVHTWEMESSAAFSTYFLDNGHLLRSASRGGGMMGFGGMGGFGGRGFGRGQRGGAPVVQESENQRRPPSGIGGGGKIQEIDWGGNIVWEYDYATDTQVPHHDIEKMPNGNILLICWDGKTDKESIAAGRNPQYQNGEPNPDCIVEIKPAGDNKWEVVWKWYVWDHLIQDFDPNKPNYGKVSEHPELIDINYSERWVETAQGAQRGNRGGGFGGMGGGMMGGGGAFPVTDWTHLNAIDYNEELDLIIVSSYTLSEIWVIDHSTTTEQAKGHTGGKHGKGGDLIYRYGNPAAYRQGTNDDQKFFSPHDIHWIAKGLPGEGHMLIFNNGPGRPDGRYSSVEEFILPIDDNGNFKMDGKVFAAVEPVWQYMDANNKTNFYAMNISGVQRLPNGNTLICEGSKGHLFEITPDKETVWEYRFSAPGGASGGGMGAMGGFMGFRGGFGGAGGFGMRGQRVAPADSNTTAPDIAAPQGQGGAGIRSQRARGGNVGIAGAPGRGGARGGGMGGGFSMANQIFRAYRIAADNPALADKGLNLRKSSEEEASANANENN